MQVPRYHVVITYSTNNLSVIEFVDWSHVQRCLERFENNATMETLSIRKSHVGDTSANCGIVGDDTDSGVRIDSI